MPSGSKKRKAAKKKKAMEEAHINPSHGNAVPKSHVDKDSDGGVKSHDEKESDGGELSSPASQDHQSSQHPFGKEKVEEKRHTSSVRPFAPGNQFSEIPRNKTDEGVATEVVTELKPEKSSQGHNVSSEHVNSVKEKELHDGQSDGDNSNTSISNSDNEKDKEKLYSSIPEMTSHKDSAEPNVPVPGKVSSPIETAQTIEACNLVVETNPVVDSSKQDHSLPDVDTCDTESVFVKSLVESSAVKMGFKENDLLPSLGDVTGVLPALVGLASKGNDEKVMVNENVVVSSSEMGFASKGNGDKRFPPADVSSVKLGNVIEHVKDPEETPECTENQPLVAPAPHTAKETSWKSCCGLLDVLAGSDR